MKQLLLYTPAGWSLRDGRKAWRAGAGARAAGKPRKSPPQHGRLRTQWLAGWDAADQHIAHLATQMGTQVAVAVQTQQVAMAVAPPASMRSRPVWGRGPHHQTAGTMPWCAGARARAQGQPRAAGQEQEWLAGWDAADRHIADLAMQMLQILQKEVP